MAGPNRLFASVPQVPNDPSPERFRPESRDLPTFLANSQGFVQAGLLLPQDFIHPAYRAESRPVRKMKTVNDLKVGKAMDGISRNARATNAPNLGSTPTVLNGISAYETSSSASQLGKIQEKAELKTGKQPARVPSRWNFLQRAKAAKPHAQDSRLTMASNSHNVQDILQRLGPLAVSDDHDEPLAQANRSPNFLDRVTRAPFHVDDRPQTRKPKSNMPQSDQGSETSAAPHIKSYEPASLLSHQSKSRTNKPQHTAPVQPNSRPHGDITKEFIHFPERQNSELSYTSSSGAASFRTESTLIGPPEHSVWLGDEDVWNEYNDLSNGDIASTRAAGISKHSDRKTLSNKSSLRHDQPYQPVGLHERAQPSVPSLMENMAASHQHSTGPAADDTSRSSQTPQSATTPSTPYSISDIVAGYGDQALSGQSIHTPLSAFSQDRTSAESRRSTHEDRFKQSHRQSNFEADNGQISPITTSRDQDVVAPSQGRASKPSRQSADADLRFGALMTSKWLSFGRVLFSPAHDEVTHGRDVKVLIVDGLGKGMCLSPSESAHAD